MTANVKVQLDREVEAYLRQPGPETLSVLIEISLPPARISFPGGRPSVPAQLRTGTMKESGGAGERAAKIEQAREGLRNLLGEDLTWLAAAHVFVASLDAAQIVAVSELEFVKGIRLNRRLRR